MFLERLLEHKNNGSTPYNDYESIRKGGFVSTEEYETKGWPINNKQPQVNPVEAQARKV